MSPASAAFVARNGNRCDVCGEEMTSTLFDACTLDGEGFTGDRGIVCVRNGGPEVHLHGVAIVHPSQLTVSAALRRRMSRGRPFVRARQPVAHHRHAERARRLYRAVVDAW